MLTRLRRGGLRRLRYGAWKTGYVARDAGRRATGPLRTGPTFLIAGEMKCGSTSLYEHLLQHPAILGSRVKEVHYFDFSHQRGPAWYRSHFPTRLEVERVRRATGAEPAIGEATPYLFWPSAPRRAFELDPALKLIVIVRNPVDRAYSQYWDEVGFNKEPLSFEDALAAEPGRLAGEATRILAEPGYISDPWYRWSYAARGRYREQLDRWLDLFPREQLLVVGLEELRDGRAELDAAICRFLGVPELPLPSLPVINRKEYPAMAAATRAALEAEFEEPNRRLAELVGRDLGWTRTAASRAS